MCSRLLLVCFTMIPTSPNAQPSAKLLSIMKVNSSWFVLIYVRKIYSRIITVKIVIHLEISTAEDTSVTFWLKRSSVIDVVSSRPAPSEWRNTERRRYNLINRNKKPPGETTYLVAAVELLGKPAARVNFATHWKVQFRILKISETRFDSLFRPNCPHIKAIRVQGSVL